MIELDENVIRLISAKARSKKFRNSSGMLCGNSDENGNGL